MAMSALAAPPTGGMGPAAVKITLYRSLDAWRGVACLAVLSYHCFLSVAAPESAARHPLYFISSAGYLGVQLFFVISGYCIANAAVAATHQGGVLGFMRARVRRIYPAYLAVLVISIGLGLLAGRLHAAGRMPDGFFAHLDLLHRTGPFYFSTLTLTQVLLHQELILPVFWTLNFEAAFYVIVGLLLSLPEPLRRERTILVCLHLITLLSLAGMTLWPTRVPFPLSFWPQFGLGILVFDVLQRPKNRVTQAFFAAAALETVLFCVLRDSTNPFVSCQPPLRIGFGVCLVYAALLLALRRFDAHLVRLEPVRFLIWVGGFSYSLYLVHPMVIGVTRLAMRVILRGSVGGMAAYVVFGVEMVASVVCARAFFSLVEKRFLKKSSRPVQDVNLAEHRPAASQAKSLT